MHKCMDLTNSNLNKEEIKIVAYRFFFNMSKLNLAFTAHSVHI